MFDWLCLWLGFSLRKVRKDIDASYLIRLRRICWLKYSTAYGLAGNVPGYLVALASSKRGLAVEASHYLWCGLCHQHVSISSAALPACPFILDVLKVADEGLTVEILDILLGFAIGVNRDRAIEYRAGMGHHEPYVESDWVAELRSLLLAELPRFRQLSSHNNEEIADFAADILEELRQGSKKIMPFDRVATPG